ncbi:NAD(P)-binding protein [Lentithecium fluviatile CBS 122367]|uniref:NAD(P)-binding protein n=1 Tax=Lentithecium fluviatile CBS 122367 TaxID=1168545 RepID=A0A6G1JNS3_9PLEO|nr:NAD(P)-binding protein [Lentithecium fluviatile CBS 122367]
MSHVVAIAGGSGGLGRAVVDALKMDSRYEPIILARKTNPVLQNDVGVPVLQADYSDPDSLVQLLEDNKIDTVISTIAGLDQAPEVNLIKAADRSTITRRFIPSVWSGFDYTQEQAKVSPMAAARLTLLDAMKATTSLEWTAIFPGVFLDFYALSTPSHVPRNAMAIDIDANAAAIPGDGTYPVYFTHSTDIAKWTVALLGLKDWETKYFLVGDTKTWNEFIAIAEAAKGVKFDVAYDPIEKLERGEITELPGNKALYELSGGKAMFQKFVAQIAVWMAEGRMLYKAPFLNEMFPDIRPLTVKAALSKN